MGGSTQRESCPHCDKTYKNKESLRKHLKLVGYKKPNPHDNPQHQVSASAPALAPINTNPVHQLIGNIGLSPQPLPPVGQLLDDQDLFRYIMVQQLYLMNCYFLGVNPAHNGTMIVPTPVVDNSLLQAPSAINNHNNNYNQNLHVLCLTPKDDLLQILTNQSNLKEAFTYIKNCALSGIAGDCRLISKVYLNIPKPVLMYGNKSKTQFVYYDMNQKRTVESNPQVIAKLLAENLQRSYLKGSSSLKDSDGELISVNSDHPYLPVTEEYDLQMWNDHVYELNDEKYQKKVLKSLSIPFESDVLFE